MPKKFKHKKTGDIVELISRAGYKLYKSTIGLIPAEYIENSSDWEEIVEREWKILDTMISDDLEQSISSVKRLSDGEIFTIGDKLTEGTILTFSLSDYNDGIYADTIKVSGDDMYYYCGLPLNKWVKLNQPLFTTEDGVDIYSGDCFYHVDKEFRISQNHGFSGISEKIFAFSTKKAAKNYITCNKPCLSFNDVWNISNNKSSDNNYVIIDKRKLKEFVKSKL
jgi:hypothetical protein